MSTACGVYRESVWYCFASCTPSTVLAVLWCRAVCYPMCRPVVCASVEQPRGVGAASEERPARLYSYSYVDLRKLFDHEHVSNAHLLGILSLHEATFEVKPYGRGVVLTHFQGEHLGIRRFLGVFLDALHQRRSHTLASLAFLDGHILDVQVRWIVGDLSHAWAGVGRVAQLDVHGAHHSATWFELVILRQRHHADILLPQQSLGVIDDDAVLCFWQGRDVHALSQQAVACQQGSNSEAKESVIGCCHHRIAILKIRSRSNDRADVQSASLHAVESSLGLVHGSILLFGPRHYHLGVDATIAERCNVQHPRIIFTARHDGSLDFCGRRGRQ
mmetsp:Transcript_23037/g.64191  ORF Transcript_23037/g.64191 Transcript_23037/m.64191 type:complete len:331 (+) Transcript_23037:111-1103(+)